MCACNVDVTKARNIVRWRHAMTEDELCEMLTDLNQITIKHWT